MSFLDNNLISSVVTVRESVSVYETYISSIVRSGIHKSLVGTNIWSSSQNSCGSHQMCSLSHLCTEEWEKERRGTSREKKARKRWKCHFKNNTFNFTNRVRSSVFLKVGSPNKPKCKKWRSDQFLSVSKEIEQCYFREKLSFSQCHLTLSDG